MAKEKANEPASDDQQAQADQQKAPAPERSERRLDYAPNGGRYLVNGVLVDANGQPVKE